MKIDKTMEIVLLDMQIRCFYFYSISANSLLAKSRFCMTILKEESHGLILINHRYRSRNPMLMQKSFSVQNTGINLHT